MPQPRGDHPRILVDASAAFDQGAGIGRYSRNVLSRLMPAMPHAVWKLVYAPAGASSPAFALPGADLAAVTRLPFSRRRADQLWFRARAPLDVRVLAGRADIVYSPDFTAPPAFGVPHVVTVHDLAFLTHPETASEALRRYLSTVVPRQIASAAHVMVVSEATRQDVIAHFGVPEARISVARNGVDERFFTASPPTVEQRRRLALPDNYLLMVGTIEPRKNHRNVLAAQTIARAHGGLPLVIAGRYGWGDDALVDVIRECERAGDVLWLEYAPEDDLPALYAGSRAVVYPSWTEGFGLPVVEALAAGRPVITGTAPALREVAGSHARHVDPGDIEALANAMIAMGETTSGDDDVAVRREWARTFSWDQSVQTIRDVLTRMSSTR